MREKLFRFQQRQIAWIAFGFVAILLLLMVRTIYVCVGNSKYLSEKALEVQQRERKIKAMRGRILDRNGVVLADNKVVCTISVIHNQIDQPEEVVKLLSEKLGMDEKTVAAKVQKLSSMERIKSNVSKEIGDEIRKEHLNGVKVDEDYKRFYPYGVLGSKVLGFTGSDNQGIIGLESLYEDILTGTEGKILTMTDARGVEVKGQAESRQEPVDGNDLQISIDVNIQLYATQLANAALINKEAKSVSILVMEVKTGEILAMVNAPEFDLNDPFVSTDQEVCNAVWRNGCINDTYEPGSIFKIITASAALEEDVVNQNSTFFCPGYIVVSDRKIRCSKTGGHGSQTFVEATANSCNPAFISLGLSLGTDRFYDYFQKFHLMKKTGIDLPGEAMTIMHKKENMKEVELATCAFGQSFQVTPIRLLTTIASLLNGGQEIVPHLALASYDKEGNVVHLFEKQAGEQLVSKETAEILHEVLEKVVDGGTGSNGAVEGYRIGGKTATSQTIPRGNGIYIASFMAFAPADDPEVIALAVVNEPKGVYYGGQVAAPIVRQLYENILPYLGIEKIQTE